MAPKPKMIFRRDDVDDGFWWSWDCPCGERCWSTGSLPHVYNDAVEHSRTHTAERIAEELERWVASDEVEAQTFHNVPSFRDYWLGRRDGTRDSTALIREHLVKEST